MDVQFRALSLDPSVPHEAAGSAVPNPSGNEDKATGRGRGSRRRQRDTRMDQPAAIQDSAQALTAPPTAHLPVAGDDSIQNSDGNHAAASRPRGRGRGKKQSSQTGLSVAGAENSESTLPASVTHYVSMSAVVASEAKSDAVADAAVPSKSKSRRRRRDHPRGAKAANAPVAPACVDSVQPTWTTFGDTVGRVGVVAPEVRRCRAVKQSNP
jgi:hypothetical protein